MTNYKPLKDVSRIESLIKRFNEMNPDYHAENETIPGNYRWYVNITEPVCKITTTYTFRTREDFRRWMDGVVLD